MKKAPHHAWIGWKGKSVLLLLVLALGAGALVLAFAAGFATSAVISETGAKDKCAGVGTWDADHDVCVKEVKTVVVATGDAYACGDGSSFTLLETGSSTARLTRDGAAYDLSRPDPDVTRYADSRFSVAVAGPEASFRDAEAGTGMLCLKQE